MELEVALKVGFLYVPPQHFLRKTWTKKYCALYSASNHGIQRIELFETEEAFTKLSPSKIVPLTDCWKVTPLPQKNQPNVFEVRTKTSTYQYSTDTFQEMSEWLVAFQTAAFNKSQGKALSTSVLTTDEKQEENMLYCSMDEPEVYAVKAVATEAVLRNNLQGDYKLIITTVNFSLSEENSQGRLGKVILTWPYRHIRRYGCSPETFSFEAGRKCSSGEGLFTFATADGSKIFQSIDGHVSALKSTQEGAVPNSPVVKEDRNNSFTLKDSLKFDELVLSHNVSKSNQSFTFDVNPELSLNTKIASKPSPPVKKPPRKSKSGVYDQNIESTSSANQISVQDSPNQYAEICTVENYETVRKSPEKPLYIRKDSGDLSDVSRHSFSENAGNVMKTPRLSDADELSTHIENIRLIETIKKDSATKQHGSNLDYENYNPTFISGPQCSRSAAEHVYGKLSNTKKNKPAESLYGTIVTQSNASTKVDSSPIYCNVPYLKEPPINNDGEIDPDPHHFLKNDAEYAQVLKKNKNIS
ncbi:hypothetical protein JTE90_011030 [Oedothorax gibbosus]|uniref:Insulin receptor substrate 1 n=1 Tax=Oedothorax gibbosus TaxID=931172 RepID=A0AAV6VET7_9ARAC|nr:hypothetical protein JTE90_011030 [Oedothorax gibbosus]